MIDKNKQYVTAAILYILAYIYAIEIAPLITKHASDSAVEKTHRSCLVKNQTVFDMRPLLQTRGAAYYIGADSPSDLDNCVVTFWGGTHMALYFMLGLFTDLFWETFAIGVAFEMYEYVKYDCHDGFDIVLNTTGFILGNSIRRCIKKC